MFNLLEIEEQIRILRGRLLQLQEEFKDSPKNKRVFILAEAKMVNRRLLGLWEKRRYENRGKIIKVTGYFLNLESNDIRVKKGFTMFFEDLPVEDIKTLVKEKIPFVNIETIEIHTIELGTLIFI